MDDHDLPGLTTEPVERAILVGVRFPKEDAEDEEYDLKELAQLTRTAGAAVLQSITQERRSPEPATFIGKGKAEEIGALADEVGANLVIFEDNLTPVQQRNLEERLGLKVIDRTQLILDIFAQRARTSEGKLQVELAQMTYLATRLIGRGHVLSRLGGGIGTRGPGETQLETDRRKIRQRIVKLKERLASVRRARSTQRKGRKRKGMALVALVGYTNAGKSTLLNTLTGADVFVEDKLFATLDPTVRKLVLPGGNVILFSDTVGFIHDIPPQLIEAFKATLEEVSEADILVHVVDATHPRAADQIEAVRVVLAEMEVLDKPLVTACNKTDRMENSFVLRRLMRDQENAFAISALTGAGIPKLVDALERELKMLRGEAGPNRRRRSGHLSGAPEG